MTDLTISGERTMGRAHALVTGKLLALALAMFGFGYLMVPLYDIICEVTGLNGKTGRVSVAEAATAVVEDRDITVEFVAIVNAGGAWEFRPTQATMTVQPGRLYDTTFYARNLTPYAVVGQSSPSVSPFVAAKYFDKTECFCFTRQEFAGNEGREMPLVFIIDPDLPPNVDRITLSYTIFSTEGAPS